DSKLDSSVPLRGRSPEGHERSARIIVHVSAGLAFAVEDVVETRAQPDTRASHAADPGSGLEIQHVVRGDARRALLGVVEVDPAHVLQVSPEREAPPRPRQPRVSEHGGEEPDGVPVVANRVSGGGPVDLAVAYE